MRPYFVSVRPEYPIGSNAILHCSFARELPVREKRDSRCGTQDALPTHNPKEHTMTTTTRLDALKQLIAELLDTLSADERLIIMERIQRYDHASQHDEAVLERYLRKILEEYGVTT
jgi:hypothetical protein